MKTFECYYKFEHLKGTKAMTRLVCLFSTGNYPPFEKLRTTKAAKATAKKDACSVGELSLRLCRLPERFKVEAETKPNLVLVKNGNISSIKQADGFLSGAYVPGYENALIGFGDFCHTPDALLFVLRNVEYTDGRLKDGATVEVFVAKRQACWALRIWQAARLPTVPLLQEMEALRKQARPETFAGENGA